MQTTVCRILLQLYIIFIEDVLLFDRPTLKARSIYANNERKSYESMYPETLPFLHIIFCL